MCIYFITQNIFQAHILTYSNYYVQISLKQYSLKMFSWLLKYIRSDCTVF